MVDLRDGVRLAVRNHPLDFSFWPVQQRRRVGAHPMVYASDAWGVMDSAVTRRCTKDSDRRSALAFLRQAREYHRAAESARVAEAQPVLHYYSFLNLAKALALASGRSEVLTLGVKHGLSHVSGSTVDVSELAAYPTTSSTANVFDELHSSVSGVSIGHRTTYSVKELIAQSIFGHRLWSQASRSNSERFAKVDAIHMMESRSRGEAWINLLVLESDRTRRGWSVTRMKEEARLSPDWESVTGPVDIAGRRMRVFQQTNPIGFGHRPADAVLGLVAQVKPILWRSIYTARPYRTYYLYLSPASEPRLPQLASLFAVMFYLGSVTRYRPTEFLAELGGSYGAFIREFIASQPQQFIFGIASEFAEQEISKASAV